MKFQLLSDYHSEFYRDRGDAFIASLDPTGIDALLVPGDVGNADTTLYSLQSLCEKYSGIPVVYILGNHELYRSSQDKMKASLRVLQARHPNFHFLDNEVVEIQGVRIAGTTLWFREDPLNAAYAYQLSDFHHIQKFTPWVYEENRAAEKFLREVLQGESPPEVVMTHHLPSEACVAPIYAGSPINRFFVAPLADELPAEHLPKIWAYGHTHTPGAMTLKGCLFVTNPRGYPNEPKQGYQPKLILEVEPRRHG